MVNKRKISKHFIWIYLLYTWRDSGKLLLPEMVECSPEVPSQAKTRQRY